MTSEKVTDQNKLNFLWDAANLLSPTSHANLLLKSYYLTIYRRISKDKPWSRSKKEFSSQAMCTKCSVAWSNGNFSLQTIPKKMCSSKAKKLVEQLHSKKEMNKKLRKRAKWYQKKIFPNVEFTCKICNHKTNIKLHKPKIRKQAVTENSEEHISPVKLNKKKKKKKKKKKDKLVGLKIDKKHIDKPSQSIQTQIISPKSSENVVQSIIDDKVTNKIQVIKPKTTKSTSSITMNKSIVKKQKKPVISKTQKNNTLLQLANILKNSSGASHNNLDQQNVPNNKRLQNLLRKT